MNQPQVYRQRNITAREQAVRNYAWRSCRRARAASSGCHGACRDSLGRGWRHRPRGGNAKARTAPLPCAIRLRQALRVFLESTSLHQPAAVCQWGHRGETRPASKCVAPCFTSSPGAPRSRSLQRRDTKSGPVTPPQSHGKCIAENCRCQQRPSPAHPGRRRGYTRYMIGSRGCLSSEGAKSARKGPLQAKRLSKHML